MKGLLSRDAFEGSLTSLLWRADGVGERLRRHRHADPAF